jgi:hypothetical protein
MSINKAGGWGPSPAALPGAVRPGRIEKTIGVLNTTVAASNPNSGELKVAVEALGAKVEAGNLVNDVRALTTAVTANNLGAELAGLLAELQKLTGAVTANDSNPALNNAALAIADAGNKVAEAIAASGSAIAEKLDCLAEAVRGRDRDPTPDPASGHGGRRRT